MIRFNRKLVQSLRKEALEVIATKHVPP